MKKYHILNAGWQLYLEGSRRNNIDYISIRLELHSNSIIPADYWFKLVEKRKEFQIKTDKALRRKEQKFVHKLAV
jgi:hypothetical protein